jgi:hypothetical protein
VSVGVCDKVVVVVGVRTVRSGVCSKSNICVFRALITRESASGVMQGEGDMKAYIAAAKQGPVSSPT